ncbi:hypothetical protein U9M48_033384 [Paspalum notatum var. saurae]|uniref:Uncharacterized protein n=1 Tax=Paspalum notatum var. saurae TaxID=547442 RepID=A0AAQ3X685_PASNO
MICRLQPTAVDSVVVASAAASRARYYIMMLMVCRPPTRLHAHESGGGDRSRGRMMHSSSSCSLATSTTSRRHGTKTNVTGMIQIARSRISIAAPHLPAGHLSLEFRALILSACSGWPPQPPQRIDGWPAACFASWTSVALSCSSRTVAC